MENKIRLKEVSAFFPAYNEEGNIKNVVEKAEKVLEEYAEKYEIIVVDDGSSDRTAEVVKELSFRNNKIRLISHEKNMGYGMALRTGFKNCNYEWIVFIDSDGQFDFSEFPNFINEQKKTKADLVVGYYKRRKVSFQRKINSRLWQLLVWSLLGLKVRDIDCGFKLIRKNIIDSMTLTSERGAFISTEFLVKAKEQDAKIVEIPVSHYPRRQGDATGADLKVIISSFRDLYKIKKRLIRFIFVGLTSALMSLLVFNLFFIMGMMFTPALAIALLSTILYSFLMKRYFVFSAGEGPWGEQIWKFMVVYAASNIIQFVASHIAKNFLGETVLMANLSIVIGIAVYVPFSFLTSLLWVFKGKKL